MAGRPESVRALTLLRDWYRRGVVPHELEEAAVVDGAHLFQIPRHVILPLVPNGLIAPALFVVVHAWNELVFALVFTTRNARTTPLLMSEMPSTIDGVDWGVLFAAATIRLLPVPLFVLAAQRYVTAGLMAGAVKGQARGARGFRARNEPSGNELHTPNLHDLSESTHAPESRERSGIRSPSRENARCCGNPAVQAASVFALCARRVASATNCISGSAGDSAARHSPAACIQKSVQRPFCSQSP